MSELTPIVIFGAGGFAREVLELIRDINDVGARFDIVGFLDDHEAHWLTEKNGIPVLGGSAWLERQANPPAVVLGIGSPALKRRVVERLRPRVSGFPSLVHPTVVMSRFVECGPGVIIAAGNILTANIQLGSFTTINLACTVGHDVRIGSHSTVAPGVNISGNVSINEGCDIGTGASIIQGVNIGAWSIVGAGAVVARDVPSNCTAVGVPAKCIKMRDDGWHMT